MATAPTALRSSATAAAQTLARAALTARRSGRLHHPFQASASAASRRLGHLLHPSPLHVRLRRSLSVSASGDAGRYDYDLFTIGAGSGGMRASRFASTLYGARAAVCEMPFATVASDALGGVGGTCVIRGCVPKKLLVYASKYSYEFEESRGFGWMYETGPKHEWSTLMTKKNLELQRLVGFQTNMLKNSGVTLIEGRGKVV